MSIPESTKKINLIVLLSIIVALGLMLAFGGLKLFAYEGEKEPIRFIPAVSVGKTAVTTAKEPAAQGPAGQTDVQPNQSAKSAQIVAQNVVASKTGKKYYLSGCSGAKRITEKNKITFKNIAAAESAGLTPAANCPGLNPDSKNK